MTRDPHGPLPHRVYRPLRVLVSASCWVGRLAWPAKLRVAGDPKPPLGVPTVLTIKNDPTTASTAVTLL